MGDPSGVGPEVTLKALASPKVSGLANFLVVGNTFVLEKAARDMGLDVHGRFMDIDNVPKKGFSYGRPSPAYGRASIDYIDKAVRLIKLGRGDCLVTAPINKRSVSWGGLKSFEGHTEYLAAFTGTKKVAMMFVGERFKITLVTRHIPLAEVPASLSVEKIYKTVILTAGSLKKDFGVRRPKIAVAGLNPHAGENGMFGGDEKRVIVPAIRKASKKIPGIYGPIPPDVVFNECLNGKYDACVAMYHDQGLIPFKLLYFKTGVNMTIGLPFVRTSPDHGTAFDIAGKGIADPSSMIEAIRLACRIVSPVGRSDKHKRCSRRPS